MDGESLKQKSRNDSGKLTSRRSQTLLGIGYADAAPIGWDGRRATLEAQVKSSIATGSMSMRDTATPVKVEEIEERIRSNPAYVTKFKAALAAAAINLDSIAQAIAAFERTIEPGIAPGSLQGSSHAWIASINPPTPKILITRFML